MRVTFTLAPVICEVLDSLRRASCRRWVVLSPMPPVADTPQPPCLAARVLLPSPGLNRAAQPYPLGKIRMSHRLFFALLLLPLYGPTLANGKDIVASPSSAKVIVFLDGRWMRVQHYIAVEPVVLSPPPMGNSGRCAGPLSTWRPRSGSGDSIGRESSSKHNRSAKRLFVDWRSLSSSLDVAGNAYRLQINVSDKALTAQVLVRSTKDGSKEAEKSEAAVRIFERRKKYAYAILRNCSPS